MATEIQHGMVVDGHLGGYVPGGDPATFYPDLWEWLVNGPEQVRSVLDVGAGDGVALDYFLSLGCDVTGIDGIAQEHDLIVEHDYTTGPLVPGDVDLVWSCEFVEHVEEQHVDNFLATFACGRLVLMTHAGIGQAGWHHVNCQRPQYWTEKLAGIGYEVDAELTVKCRDLAAMNREPYNHFVRSGKAYRRIG